MALGVDGGGVEDVESKQGYHDGLEDSLEGPHEEVSVVKDAVFLPDEVDLGKQPIYVFVHLVPLGHILPQPRLQDVRL